MGSGSLKRGVKKTFCKAKKGTQWDLKISKMGVITRQHPYSVEVWECPPRAGRVTPRISRIVNMMYGAMAVTYTTCQHTLSY